MGSQDSNLEFTVSFDPGPSSMPEIGCPDRSLTLETTISTSFVSRWNKNSIDQCAMPFVDMFDRRIEERHSIHIFTRALASVFKIKMK